METTQQIEPGTIGEALDADSWPYKWRPAQVTQLAPYEGRAGYYVAWLDVDHRHEAVSKGGWKPGHMFRAKVVQLAGPTGVTFAYAQAAP